MLSRTLNVDMLIPIVQELLLKPLGKVIHENIANNNVATDVKTTIESLGDKLREFSPNSKEVRAIYFGLNGETQNLHWLLLNKAYKTTEYSENNKRHESDIFKKELILSKVFEKVEDIYDPYNFSEIPSHPQKNGSGKEIGLAMLAFKKKKPFYSPFAIKDSRSYKAGVFDCNVGCETTFYLPILRRSKKDTTAGVLLIFFDAINRTNYLPVDLDAQGNVKDKKTFQDANKVENAFKKIWGTIFRNSTIVKNIKVLDSLFNAHLETYMDYVKSFDNFLVQENIKIISDNSSPLFIANDLGLNERQRSSLRNLFNLKVKAFNYLETFFQKNKNTFPTINYLETLKELEPLLQSLGKKDHYLHMFKTFLFGNLLIDRWVSNNKRKNLIIKAWSLIAFSHDIGYPIEMVEGEMGAFFEKYFHKKKIPNILVSKELLWSYGNFSNYRELLKKGLLDLFDDKNKAELFIDIMEYQFHKFNDHAIISALFTMKCVDLHWKKLNLKNKYKNVIDSLCSKPFGKDDFLILIGIPILLHNFYQWKYFYKYKLEEICKTGNIEKYIYIPDDKEPDNIALSPKCDELFSHLWDRQCFESMSKKGIVNKLNQYKSLLGECTISPIDLNPNKNRQEILRYFTFLLSFTDFFQESGRVRPNKNEVPVGLYITDFSNGDNGYKLNLRTPLVMRIQPEDVKSDDNGNIHIKQKSKISFLEWIQQDNKNILTLKPTEDELKNKSKTKAEIIQSNYEKEIEKKKRKAQQKMDAWKKMKSKDSMHPYAMYLQTMAAYKVYEFENKFKNVFSTKHDLIVTWENLFISTDKKNLNKRLELNLKRNQ